jgi:hypothetical protein
MPLLLLLCACLLQFVDKRGIRWELQVLENRSEDVEEEQGLRGEERRDAILVGAGEREPVSCRLNLLPVI